MSENHKTRLQNCPPIYLRRFNHGFQCSNILDLHRAWITWKASVYRNIFDFLTHLTRKDLSLYKLIFLKNYNYYYYWQIGAKHPFKHLRKIKNVHKRKVYFSAHYVISHCVSFEIWSEVLFKINILRKWHDV